MFAVIKGIKIQIDEDDYWRLEKHRWCKATNDHIYFVRNDKGKIKYLHREIMNCPKGLEIDHISGDTTDNRKRNLRICTRMQNIQNSSKSKNNKTGYKGVIKVSDRVNKTNKYCAMISSKIYGRKNLGYYKTPEEAHDAYSRKAKEWFKEFARVE